MSGFLDIRFPTDISYGSVGGPGYNTRVVATSSGDEKRRPRWTYPLDRWDVAYGVKSMDDLKALVSFFHVVKGMAYSFRFYVESDHEAEDSVIGEGNGSETAFQLIKVYTEGAYTGARKITKPITGTVTATIDSVPEVAFTVDTSSGVITFDTPPADNAIIQASFQYDLEMRFNADSIDTRWVSYELGSASVELKEVRYQ